jgi:hypothetical protein
MLNINHTEERRDDTLPEESAALEAMNRYMQNRNYGGGDSGDAYKSKSIPP